MPSAMAMIASAALAVLGASDRCSPDANSATRRSSVTARWAGSLSWVVPAGAGCCPGAIRSSRARAGGGASSRRRSPPACEHDLNSLRTFRAVADAAANKP